MTDRYTVERKLGRGGMATVYLARDTVLDRPVALKVLAEHLADDDEFRERFLREARLAAKFVHPNVVQVYDADEDGRGPFIVMEYVDGHTLADELKRRGRLPPAEVVGIGIQVCAALEAAHEAGLVHRDIKPQNILLRPDGRVKIADFGIARSLEATRHTEIGTVLGTAAYLAPEQARGEE
ncbi:MAG TPA: protein kinase, partial [Gaiellaceae bacterium]|nr:protein kinase [Gaiellaceae bacterium]